MEHRWGQRRSTNVTVRFRTMPSTSGMGRLVNISRRGSMGVGLEWCEFAAETTPVYARLARGLLLTDTYQLPLPSIPDAR
jgi:hypothetical protein